MSKKETKSKGNTKEKSVADVKGPIPYHKVTVTCACGATFEAGSTLESIHVDICSNCHPFFTGEKRIIDTEGRVEKFKKKYKLDKS
ncbi:MAG: 50S ribosomal protein L31 [Candidatus Margulisbacteria bacterium]|nr:50S ribosomal protein L31 [Candidatus Margulisiibacteriota bacterium]